MSLDQLQDDWTRLGKEDPLWAVYVAPGTKGGKWDVDAFFALGRDEVDGVFAEFQRLGLTPGRHRALDFGCGVGRLSQALAEHVDEVVGVDISPTMLEKARELDRSGGRCRFVLNEATDLAVVPVRERGRRLQQPGPAAHAARAGPRLPARVRPDPGARRRRGVPGGEPPHDVPQGPGLPARALAAAAVGPAAPPRLPGADADEPDDVRGRPRRARGHRRPAGGRGGRRLLRRALALHPLLRARAGRGSRRPGAADVSETRGTPERSASPEGPAA